MPTKVKLEVERYLTCGDARFGFVEFTCERCAEVKRDIGRGALLDHVRQLLVVDP